MDYLKNYNLSDQDINEIINNIDENDIIEYDIHEENISKILDYLYKNGFDIKNLLIKKSYLFYTDAKVLINKIKELDTLELKNNIDLFDDLV